MLSTSVGRVVVPSMVCTALVNDAIPPASSIMMMMIVVIVVMGTMPAPAVYLLWFICNGGVGSVGGR